MISSNIKFLRECLKLTQEELAEKLEVSRQTVAKWENGTTLPDVMKCIKLAEMLNTTVEAFVTFDLDAKKLDALQQDGKYVFGIVKLGERGQMVIPKYAREISSLTAGSRMIVLGDSHKGIALVKI